MLSPTVLATAHDQRQSPSGVASSRGRKPPFGAEAKVMTPCWLNPNKRTRGDATTTAGTMDAVSASIRNDGEAESEEEIEYLILSDRGSQKQQ